MITSTEACPKCGSNNVNVWAGMISVCIDCDKWFNPKDYMEKELVSFDDSIFNSDKDLKEIIVK